MSFHVALQSVAFYVLSCSSCAKIKHRRRAKAQARRERAQRAMLQALEPDAYLHPEPFATNPYWNEEILMGPELVKKSSSRRAASRQNSIMSHDTLTPTTDGGDHSPHEHGRDGAGSLVDIPEEEPCAIGDKWNWRRYQREDEALWGRDMFAPGQKLLERLSKAGTAARARMEHTLGYALSRDDDATSDGHSIASGYSNYYLPRNPPVNDLHPPVVSSTPASMAEVKWMLQPPPAARIMEGKERPTPQRSRDGSTCAEYRQRLASPLVAGPSSNSGHGPWSLARASTEPYLAKPMRQRSPMLRQGNDVDGDVLGGGKLRHDDEVPSSRYRHPGRHAQTRKARQQMPRSMCDSDSHSTSGSETEYERQIFSGRIHRYATPPPVGIETSHGSEPTTSSTVSGEPGDVTSSVVAKTARGRSARRKRRLSA